MFQLTGATMLASTPSAIALASAPRTRAWCCAPHDDAPHPTPARYRGAARSRRRHGGAAGGEPGRPAPAQPVAGRDLRQPARTGAVVALACADACRLPLADGSIDVVHSALLLHHFRPPALAALLAEAWRVARHALVMNDLVRHAVPVAFLRRTGFLFSPITRH